MIFKYVDIDRSLINRSLWIVIDNNKTHNIGVISQVIKCVGYIFLYRKGHEDKITINENDKFIIMSESERKDRDFSDIWQDLFESQAYEDYINQSKQEEEYEQR